MPYNRYRNKSYIESNSRLEDNRFAGVKDLDSKLTDSGSIDIDFEGINTEFNSYTSTNMPFQYFQSGLKGVQSDAAIWAMPTASGSFESLVGLAANGNLTSPARYDKSVFDFPSTYSIKPSNFPGLTKGCLWYAISLWHNVGTTNSSTIEFLGTCYINYREHKATGSNGLRDLFAPTMFRPTEAYVVHGTGSHHPNFFSESFVDSRAGTYFSSEQSPGDNGYYSSAGFSLSDGIWGYRAGTFPLDGASVNGFNLTSTGGTYGQQCFGIQNYNSTDSTVNDIFWGDTVKYNSLAGGFRCMIWTVFE
jgi:hypothetical protein